MIIQKTEDCFCVKVYKEYLGEFDFFDKDSIQELFQKILKRILEQYELKGILDVDVYVNDKFGLIMEIREFSSYFDDIDMHLHFHIGSVFLTEVDFDNIVSWKDIYYYQGKFYRVYQGLIDSSILYKESEEIIEKGIKVC